MKTIERVKIKLNPELEIKGVLLTMYDKRNKLSAEVDTEARKFFADRGDKIKGKNKIVSELEKNEKIDKNLLKYMTIKVKEFDLKTNYFSTKAKEEAPRKKYNG